MMTTTMTTTQSPAHPSSAAPKGKNQALLEAVSGPSPAVTNEWLSGFVTLFWHSTTSEERRAPHPPPQTPQSAKELPVTPRQNSDHIHNRQPQPQSQPRPQPKPVGQCQGDHGRDDARRPPGITIPPVAATTAQLATSPQISPAPQQIHQRQQLHATPPIEQAPSPRPHQEIFQLEWRQVVQCRHRVLSDLLLPS
jgi:hypothetical protein